MRLPRPFLALVDSDGRSSGWCALTGPLQEQDRALYDRLRSRYRFIGLTSYETFPRTDEGVFADYSDLCEGWCHCFRDPGLYISAEVPLALISESDFTNPSAIQPRPDAPKEFDFVYVCLPGVRKELRKNWALAKQCLPALCLDMGLSGLVLGRWQILDLPFRTNLTVVGDLRRHEVLEYLALARFLLVPNVIDASPRIIAESLCSDVPVIMNGAILGGWKYVDEPTGAFFTSKDDIGSAVEACLASRLDPRRWFADHYGPDLTSRRLAGFLRRVDSSISPDSRLLLSGSLAPPTDRRRFGPDHQQEVHAG
jgi:glycosyltransferase involved in cell wall biosynthesis